MIPVGSPFFDTQDIACARSAPRFLVSDDLNEKNVDDYRTRRSAGAWRAPSAVLIG